MKASRRAIPRVLFPKGSICIEVRAGSCNHSIRNERREQGIDHGRHLVPYADARRDRIYSPRPYSEGQHSTRGVRGSV